MKTLFVIERGLLAAAAVLAIAPLWQFYAESEARNLDRAANALVAWERCIAFEKGENTIFLSASTAPAFGRICEAVLEAIESQDFK